MGLIEVDLESTLNALIGLGQGAKPSLSDLRAMSRFMNGCRAAAEFSRNPASEEPPPLYKLFFRSIHAAELTAEEWPQELRRYADLLEVILMGGERKPEEMDYVTKHLSFIGHVVAQDRNERRHHVSNCS